MRFLLLGLILLPLSIHAAPSRERCVDALVGNVQGQNFDRVKLSPYQVATWVQENRKELKWSIETVAYKLWLFGFEVSTNKIWRLEQNLVDGANRPLQEIDYNFIVALEGIFGKSILGARAVRTRADFLFPVEVAKWVQIERQNRGWSLEKLSRQLKDAGYDTSPNMLYRLEQNLVINGKRPLQTIAYEFLRSLRVAFRKQ